MRARRALAVTGAAATLGVSLGGVAYADNIQDDIVDSGTVALVAGSSTTGTANIKVVGNSADGTTTDSGCNWDPGEAPLVLNVQTPTGVTASPAQLSITDCGVNTAVTFTAGSTAVSGAATVSIVSTPAGGGGYNNQVNIPITITQPAVTNTAPQVSVTGPANGQTYQKSSVPTVGCSVTDAEDTGESATPTITNGAYNDLGSHTASCSYTDHGSPALTGSDSVTYTVVRDTDTTAPVISYTLNPTTPDGDNDWYKGDVSLKWTVTEAESPETLSKTGCADQTITADQASTTYKCSATSEGGNAPEQSVTIKRDSAGPVVTYTSVDGTPKNGWYNSDVTATFTGTDALSGPASATKTVKSSGEGSAVTLDSPAFTDAAGNTTAAGAAHSPALKIDKTGPTDITFSGVKDYYFGDNQTAPSCDASDALSGLAACVVTGGGSETGTQTWTATATDNAGNVSTAPQTYTVLPWSLKGFYQPVDLSGVWNTVKGGSTVPLKFEAFAGSTEKTSTSAVKAFTVKGATCPGASAPTDDIELVTTGGTSLRYDTTAGQFVQNWATPKKPGTCYTTTMTTQDGSSISANFMLK